MAWTRPRARIFDPFFTTKPPGKGSGLGLTVAHATVQEAEGFISVSSAVGQGSTFHLHFPARPALASAHPAPVVDRAPVALTAPTTVLLCDDEDVLRRATRQMLELAGMSVVDAATSEGLLRELLARPDDFALVLTDVVLPDLSGPELARRIHALRPKLPVVFMSEEAVHGRDAHADDRAGARTLT